MGEMTPERISDLRAFASFQCRNGFVSVADYLRECLDTIVEQQREMERLKAKIEKLELTTGNYRTATDLQHAENAALREQLKGTFRFAEPTPLKPMPYPEE